MDQPDVVDDAAALDDMLFADAELTRARPWCHQATDEAACRVADHILAAVGPASPARAAPSTATGRIRVVDYGTGSGLAAKYVARQLLHRGAGDDWIRHHVELVVVDLPGPWFVAPERLKGTWDDVAHRSLTDADGRILRLDQVTGPGSVQVVVASMVFHLIPPRALPVAIDGIRRALQPGGLCVWTSPDSEPRLPGSILFHDVNRMIRSRFEALKLGDPVDLAPLTAGERREVAALVAKAAAPSDESRLTAHRQIPAHATDVTDILSCATPSFTGTARQLASEITYDDLLRVTAVPSNLKNLCELADHDDRRRVAELLLRSLALVPASPATVPSTTVPSTTVPSATVPSTTVPSTTVPSTTVPSTTMPLTWSTGEFRAT